MSELDAPPREVARPLRVSAWPQAIVHIDGDGFFAACEQAMHPAYKGRPVVTGKERGIVAAASYEAKARGVSRGTRLHEVLKICPDAIILPSDYESYSLYSMRMYEILRRFSPQVEEYSIDEAFADVTGLRRKYHGTYYQIGQNIQEAIYDELKLSVSVGVSLTKVLAKVASKYEKPYGITDIPGHRIHDYIRDLPVGKVWGIGRNTASHLNKLGVKTALDFASKSEKFVKAHFSKPFQEIWHELNGRPMYPLILESKNDYQSISKTKTFTPPSHKRDFVFAQLSKNLENACIKARRHGLSARHIVVFLKTQEFQYTTQEVPLSRPSNFPCELLPFIENAFDQMFCPFTLYRATGVVLCGLQVTGEVQPGLFDDPLKVEKHTKLYGALDKISKRFGKHTVMLTSSLPTRQQLQHEGERGDTTWRQNTPLQGENARQHLGLIRLDIDI